MGGGTGDDGGIGDDGGTRDDGDRICLGLVPVAVTGTLPTGTTGTEERIGVFTEFTEAVTPVCDPVTPDILGCGVTVN